MGKYIIKIKDLYFMWSSIVDAPVTYGMTEDDLRDYIQTEYGRQGLKDLQSRLERVEQNGTSCLPTRSVEDLILFNRAGPNETELSIDDIYQSFACAPLCRQPR